MTVLRDYICSACGGQYKSARSKEESLKAFRELFPDLKDEDKVTVCQNCFIEVMDELEPEKYRYVKYIAKN